MKGQKLTQVNNLEIRQLPIRVRWLGWESNTFALRNEGWTIHTSELAHEIDFDAKRLTLSLKDPHNKVIIVADWQITGREMFQLRERGIYEMLVHAGVEARMYKSTDSIGTRSLEPRYVVDSLDNMRLSDGFINIPFPTDPYQLKSIREFKFFNEQSIQTKEIYLPPDSVDECLNRILELQWPDHKKWARENASRIDINAPKIQAKIYSLAA